MILNSTTIGSGPPLILLHGLFGAAKNLGILARGLAPHATVTSMDLRNHGASPHALPMDFATMAADIAETMDALNIETANLAGHSLGGKTAMTLALTHPERITRLAVLDIAPISYNHDYSGEVRAMRSVPLTPNLTRHEADAALAKTVQTAPLRAFLLNNLALGEHPAWRIGLEEIAAAMPDLVTWADPKTAPFTRPTLFLRGADSHYVPDSAAPAIHRLFPNAQFASISGASHWLHADKPSEVLAALKEFFFHDL